MKGNKLAHLNLPRDRAHLSQLIRAALAESDAKLMKQMEATNYTALFSQNSPYRIKLWNRYEMDATFHTGAF